MYFCYKSERVPQISYMNRHVTDANWQMGKCQLDEYIFFLVNKGSLYIQEGREKRALHAGHFIIIEPGQTYQGYKPSFCDYYFVHFAASTLSIFDCSALNDIQKIVLDNRNLSFKSNPFNYELYEKSKLFIPKEMQLEDHTVISRITLLFQEAIHAYELKNEQYKLISSCKFIEILIELSTYFTGKTFKDPANTSSYAKITQKTEAIISYLQSHYTEKITGEEVAEHLGLNFDYINRLFKKNMGLTIFQYLNWLRINKAKEYLITGGLKSYEIAEAVGYCDEYHFSKMFKKAVGLSPAEYEHTRSH